MSIYTVLLYVFLMPVSIYYFHQLTRISTTAFHYAEIEKRREGGMAYVFDLQKQAKEGISRIVYHVYMEIFLKGLQSDLDGTDAVANRYAKIILIQLCLIVVCISPIDLPIIMAASAVGYCIWVDSTVHKKEINLCNKYAKLIVMQKETLMKLNWLVHSKTVEHQVPGGVIRELMSDVDRLCDRRSIFQNKCTNLSKRYRLTGLTLPIIVTILVFLKTLIGA